MCLCQSYGLEIFSDISNVTLLCCLDGHGQRMQENMRIKFAWDVQVAGSLARKKAKVGAQLQGVLVQQGGKHTVVAAQDLPAFTSLHPGRILQRQILSLRKPFTEVSPQLP